MRTRIRLLMAGLLALGFTRVGSAHPTYATGQQVANCSFATLQSDLHASGNYYYVKGQCSSPIVFPSGITINGNTSLTVQGNDITLDGAGKVQLFYVSSSGGFGLTGLTLTNGGYSAGGAIHNAGTLTIANSTLSGNRASVDGGRFTTLVAR